MVKHCQWAQDHGYIQTRNCRSNESIALEQPLPGAWGPLPPALALWSLPLPAPLLPWTSFLHPHWPWDNCLCPRGSSTTSSSQREEVQPTPSLHSFLFTLQGHRSHSSAPLCLCTGSSQGLEGLDLSPAPSCPEASARGWPWLGCLCSLATADMGAGGPTLSCPCSCKETLLPQASCPTCPTHSHGHQGWTVDSN